MEDSNGGETSIAHRWRGEMTTIVRSGIDGGAVEVEVVKDDRALSDCPGVNGGAGGRTGAEGVNSEEASRALCIDSLVLLIDFAIAPAPRDCRHPGHDRKRKQDGLSVLAAETSKGHGFARCRRQDGEELTTASWRSLCKLRGKTLRCHPRRHLTSKNE